ncbi:MAG: chorismate mutase [Gammaproteobacteria bacterium]
MQELITLREQVQNLDRQILELLARRKALVIQIGHLKSAQNMPIFDAQREQTLIKEYQNLAEQYQLSESFIAQLFQHIFAYAREVQSC